MPSVPIADELPSRSSFHVASAFASRGAVGLFFLVAQLALPPATYAAASSAAPESKTSSVTSLAMTAADSPVTSVESGKVVTLTAKVTVDGKAVSPGQVNFCEVPAKSCTDIHLLATVQLSTKGTAAYNFRPGAGSHGYKAEFLGNLTTAGSSSGSSTLQVTGKAVQVASATAISESGEWGQYKLSA